MIQKCVYLCCCYGDAHVSTLKFITFIITAEDAIEAQGQAGLHIELSMVKSGPVVVADVGILHEVVVCYGVLISPFLCTQFFLEEVGVKNDCGAEKVGEIFWLTGLCTDEVFGEKCFFLSHH